MTLFLSLFIIACGTERSEKKSTPPSSVDESKLTWRQGYPPHWWENVPPEQAKGWEILPQEAGFMEVILSKRNELGLLSNFAETPFVYRGVCYRTLESFWQMMKYPEGPDDERWGWIKTWIYSREQVIQFSGSKAKAAGNYANKLMDSHSANWVTFEGKKLVFAESPAGEHYELIWQSFLEKARQNPRVLEVLQKTGKLQLRPDHKISTKAPREWHYHLLWMDLREMIKQGSFEGLSSESPELIKACQNRWTPRSI